MVSLHFINRWVLFQPSVPRLVYCHHVAVRQEVPDSADVVKITGVYQFLPPLRRGSLPRQRRPQKRFNADARDILSHIVPGEEINRLTEKEGIDDRHSFGEQPIHVIDKFDVGMFLIDHLFLDLPGHSRIKGKTVVFTGVLGERSA